MKSLKRVLSLLIAAVLAMSMAGTVFAAEEYEETDEYVLNHNVSDDDYDGPRFQYFSPYITDYAYDGSPSYIQSNIFSLYNTITKEVIPAYCTDIKVGALPDHRYRRQNLEDSTYAAGAAGLLRAIVQEGFYIVPDSAQTTEEHAARVAEKLQELGKASGVTDLTIGEAISGTQTAIWQAAHGSELVFTDFVRTIYTTKMPSATKYYDLCNEERINGHVNYTVSNYGKVTLDEEADVWLNSRIKAVYDYLLSLEPVAPAVRAVSAASFVDLSAPVRSVNSDGTYDVSVTATVDVDMTAQDTLTLSAVVDSTHYAAASLRDGRQTLTLTVEDVPASLASNDVILEIDGLQTVSEVVLYDAYGERETAQSMIGMDNSQLPVHASVLATEERVINFYKTTVVATGTDSYIRRPLEGITFDIYFVAEMEDYLYGNTTLPEPEDFERPENADYVAVTDSNGCATVNLTQLGMPDGVYLVEEREHIAIKAPVAPFYVYIPATNADGTGYEYEITVQPKNDVEGTMRVEKDINTLGNNQSTVDAYANHTWIIGTNVPKDIAHGKRFVVTDTLDNRLDYVGNVRVRVETADGQSVIATLEEDTHFVMTVTDVDSLSEGKPSDTFKLELTAAGMSAVAESLGENSFDDYMLRIYFDSRVNANAGMGEEISNQAILHYTNSVNFDFEVESDEPVVYTGGVNLRKVDAGDNGTVLPGAVFELYRAATAEEVTAGSENLTTIAGVVGPVVKVSFFDNGALHGERVTEVISDEEGKVTIYGLAFGEYYLLETQAPAGYNLLGDAMKLTINATSHTEENEIVIANVSGAILPETGGIGTWVFTVTGITLMLFSTAYLIAKKRKTA